MSANRLFNRMFNILVSVTLVVMAALTLQQAAGVSSVAKAASALSANPAASPAQCLRLEPHQSITASYVKDMNMWVARSEEGPTGVDGGLIYVLSLPRCH
jgi:hypothetical protein